MRYASSLNVCGTPTVSIRWSTSPLNLLHHTASSNVHVTCVCSSTGAWLVYFGSVAVAAAAFVRPFV